MKDLDSAFDQYGGKPFLDMRLEKVAMEHLWDIINTRGTSIESHARKLHGMPPISPISKSKYIEDKDDFFWEKILKGMTEHMYHKDLEKPLTFKLEKLWVNYQKQHEFVPPHNHSGPFSFVVFMKIPIHWKEQHDLYFSQASCHPCTSDFQFLWGKKSNKDIGMV